jgi:hypothetical protein
LKCIKDDGTLTKENKNKIDLAIKEYWRKIYNKDDQIENIHKAAAISHNLQKKEELEQSML